MSQLLSIKLINQDTALQPRAKMDTAIIDEYKESMKAGDAFPAVTVFKIAEEYILVDGYHRYLAAKGAKKDKILADVHIGTMREATLFSVGVNAIHGVRRTNDDKHRAVMILLRDPEWEKWSDTEIAKACKVGTELVAKTRKSILAESARYRTDTPEPTPEKRKVKRAGKTYEMKTEKIGKKEPVVLHPNIKPAEGPPDQLPTSPSQPARGSIPVTTDPPQPSLAEQMADSKIIDGNSKCPFCGFSQPYDRSVNTVKCMGCQKTYSRKAPCTDGKPCPDGKDHKAGKKCALWGTFINQLPKDECKLDALARKESDLGFAAANKPPIVLKTKDQKAEELDAAIGAFLALMSPRHSQNIDQCMKDDRSLKTRADVISAALDMYVERRKG
jgi:hypothetical protein